MVFYFSDGGNVGTIGSQTPEQAKGPDNPHIFRA
jgi:hypothetical protein